MSLPILSILFVTFGQFLNASIVLIDKYIVTSTVISRPSTYAFYVGLLSGVVIVLLPFGVVGIPSALVIWVSILIGFTFVASIILLYSALKIANTTDVVSWLVAISTVSTFLLGSAFLNEELPGSFVPALIFFLIGIMLVGHFRFNAKSFFFVVFSGFLFGLSAVMLKYLFGHTNFVDGFFWSRMGNVFATMFLLFIPSVRKSIFSSSKQVSRKTSSLVVLNRFLGGVAFLSILYAIKLGSVSVVNALSSLQFFFVFILVILLMKKMPQLYEHEFRPGHIMHKVFAMIFIAIGFFVLFL